MRVVTWNIWEGGEGRLSQITGVLRGLDADVVALQEANDRDAAERLAASLGMHVFWGEANSPYAVAWLSREPATARNHRLPVLDKTLLELRHGSLLLFTTHLSAGRRVEDEPHRIDEMRAVLAVAAEADVLVGDFNAVHPEDEVGTPPPEEALEHVSREPIALALAAGFTDCFRALHRETVWTYLTSHPWARLDYVFARSAPTACRVVTVAGGASDHFPVVADLPF
jgi:endonuclease/exonuclease/phosphatase family metal-dependent hydrolase